MDTVIITKVFDTILSPEGLLALFSGLTVGYIIGILPAVGQGFALILLMPLAFFIRPEIAFIVYASMFGGADLGGSVTSILLNVPGNASNITTTLDGYPMARSGQAGRAIGLSAGSSIAGSVVGIATLVAVMPFMKVILYNFGSREYFLAIALSIIIAALATGYGRFAKGLVAICIGMFCSFIGNDIVYGTMRYTAGMNYFSAGVTIITLVIGLYAISELTLLQSEGESIAQAGIAKAKLSDTLKGVWEAFRSWPAVVRASIVGVLFGCVPGMGGSVTQFASYGLARMMARDKSKFGKGDPIGVIASEAVNNARDGASMLPTLFLGIPGGPEMAILLGIFLIFGITPGPGMGMEHLDLAWTIIICLMIGNVLATILSILCAPYLSKLTTMPITLITAFTFPLCFTSLFSADTEIWDFMVAGFLGILGLLMKRTGYPVAPVIIGYVLAPLAERSFHTTLQSGYYDPLIFFQSTLAKILTVGLAVVLLVPVALALRKYFWRNRKEIIPQALSGEETTGAANSSERVFMAALFFVLSFTVAFLAPHYGLRESGLWPLVVAIVMIIAASIVLASEIRMGFSRQDKTRARAFTKPDLLIFFRSGKISFLRWLGPFSTLC